MVPERLAAGRTAIDILIALGLKHRCTTGPQRRITRWEHEHLLVAVQKRLDENPQAMRQRRETVELPFGTMKARMGATHFNVCRRSQPRCTCSPIILRA